MEIEKKFRQSNIQCNLSLNAIDFTKILPMHSAISKLSLMRIFSRKRASRFLAIIEKHSNMNFTRNHLTIELSRKNEIHNFHFEMRCLGFSVKIKQ